MMTKIILGIGNPGERYAGTRHNVGIAYVHYLHTKWNFPSWRRCGTDPVFIAEGTVSGVPVVLAYSETYMNHSGTAGKALLSFFDTSAGHLLVIQDEIDMPVGEWKLSCNRGAGGHNGIRSLVDMLGTREFCRLRLGISPTTLFGKMKKPSQARMERFVLGRMSRREEKKVFGTLPVVKEKLHEWIESRK